MTLNWNGLGFKANEPRARYGRLMVEIVVLPSTSHIEEWPLLEL